MKKDGVFLTDKKENQNKPTTLYCVGGKKGGRKTTPRIDGVKAQSRTGHPKNQSLKGKSHPVKSGDGW